MGAKIIVAKAASLPEIYKNAAGYIDPENADCDLDDILGKIDGSEAEKVLSEYTYQNSAEKLFNVLFKNPLC